MEMPLARMELSLAEIRPRTERGERSSEALLAELQPLVVHTVRLVVGAGSSVAEDAAQEALLEVSRSLPQLKDRGAARAFAARIAARVAIRMAKRERRFAVLGLGARSSELGSTQPIELLELKEAFDQLPPRQRATAVLRLYVGLDEQETADALGCSVGTVKHQLHDARHKLALYLDGSKSTGRRKER